jgi:hypothetical protein
LGFSAKFVAAFIANILTGGFHAGFETSLWLNGWIMVFLVGSRCLAFALAVAAWQTVDYGR